MMQRAVIDVTHAQAEVQNMNILAPTRRALFMASYWQRLCLLCSPTSAPREALPSNGPILAKRGYVFLLSELGFYHFVLCIVHSLLLGALKRHEQCQ